MLLGIFLRKLTGHNVVVEYFLCLKRWMDWHLSLSLGLQQGDTTFVSCGFDEETKLLQPDIENYSQEHFLEKRYIL